jgi:hypothetical protein
MSNIEENKDNLINSLEARKDESKKHKYKTKW